MSVPLSEAIPDAPFTTLLGIVKTCGRPGARGGIVDELRSLAAVAKAEEMRVFKQELRDALTDPSELPVGELRRVGGYTDGRDREFLRSLWTGLYDEEPAAGGEVHLRELRTRGADSPTSGVVRPA